MSYWTELEEMIKEKCVHDNVDEEQFLQLRDEIDLHLNGQLVFEQLSPTAQELIRDWESLVMAQIEEEEKYFGINNDDERF